MRPLILITNDDGIDVKGLHALKETALEFGDVVMMVPSSNASGQSHSITSTRPLRVHEVEKSERLNVYTCDGNPVDCVKLATEHFCPRTPSLVLSGINHGSNSSINILYSGTMGAVIEASALGFTAIGFSLLNHSPNADFEPGKPYVRQIIGDILEHGLPDGVALNVNIPRVEDGNIRGLRVCRQAKALWLDSFVQRVDPRGVPYWWLTGKFVCDNPPEDSDEWALQQGYVSVVPIHSDFTCRDAIAQLQHLNR